MTEHVKRIRQIVGDDELLQSPSASVALRDADARVLMARHSEGGVWLLPGPRGLIERGSHVCPTTRWNRQREHEMVDVHASEITGPEQAREVDRVASIRLDLVPRLRGNQRQRDDLTGAPLARPLPL